MCNLYIYKTLQLQLFQHSLIPYWILSSGNVKEIAVQTDKILTGLLFCVAIGLPQYTSAASFCSASPEGKIRVDDCNYGSYDECRRTTGNQGDCVANTQEEKLPASKVAPYCLVMWSTECKYFDYETCNQAAKKQMGFCYVNPDYTNPDK
jgi:hypothetical protein